MRRSKLKLVFLEAIMIIGLVIQVSAADLIVDKSGSGDFTSIQSAINAVNGGDRILVREGTYYESLNITNDYSANYVIVQPYSGEQVTIDPDANAHGIYISGAAYIKIIGFKIKNSSSVSDKSGIRVYGSGHHIELRNNEIFNFLGSDAMGITIYGTDGADINNLIISDNNIHDCEPAHSEALVVNGNVHNFQILNNGHILLLCLQ